MKRFIQGEHRTQGTLLPERLDDYISEDHPVRVVDVFVDGWELAGLGFDSAVPVATGRPAYHPAVLLKIYIYGYLNRIQSSRRLEKEAQRNVELMWLTDRLMPDFKTIANFRKDHGKGICNVCRQFVMLCRSLDLFSEAVVVIDGSKVKAVNNRDRNFTPAKLQRRIQEIESSIAQYLAELDTADRQEPEVAQLRAGRLQEKIAALQEQMRTMTAMAEELKTAPDGQISLTDPDARSMKTRGSGIVGYNVQAAVDTKHHLIVEHEVTNVSSDRSQLSGMAGKARAAMGVDNLTAIADRGYYNGQELLKCHETGIAAIVPKSVISNATADGRFGRNDFIYDRKRDEYHCPAGERLIWRFTSMENGMTLHRYWSSNCKSCSLKHRCTPSAFRRITCWEHEDIVEAAQARLDRIPQAMRIRRQTVEHPFGTLKLWMGSAHFLMKTLKRVRTEMSLHVLSYNLKRVMKIMGIEPLARAIKA